MATRIKRNNRLKNMTRKTGHSSTIINLGLVGLFVTSWLLTSLGASIWGLYEAREIGVANAAATYIQGTAATAKSANTITATLPTTASAGDLLIAVAGMRDNVTINVPSGWSTALNNSGTPSQATFYKTSNGTETSLTVTTGSVSGSLGLQIYEYSGSSTTLDQALSTTGTSNAPTTGFITTSGTDDLIIAAFVDDINTNHVDGSWTDDTFTERNDVKTTGAGTNATYAFGDRLTGAPGSYNVSTTIGASANWRGDIISFTTAPTTYEQSAYRFFTNANSTDVGSALAAQDTPITLSADADKFRLRMNLHVGVSSLNLNSASFKLQYALQSGTCDTSFTGETYADITTTTPVSYYNNTVPTDGDNLTDNANDPVHSGHTNVNQDYEEANNFTNSVAAINAGQDGLWDFSLFDNDGSDTYCIRAVKSDGSLLNTYSVIPQVSFANTAPTGLFNSAVEKTDGSGNVDVSIEVDDNDNNDTKAKIEYESDSDGVCDGPWAAATLMGPATADFSDSGGVPDVNNANAYQVGSTATTRIITSSGSNTVDFDWDSKTDLASANGTQCLRLTVNDDVADQTTPATQTLTVDNVAPSGLTALVDTSTGSTSQTLSWTAVTETNFNHYEIWYGTNQSDVQNRTGTASEWDNADDIDLATISTTSTIISGLSSSTTYYFKIWAVDNYGNEETVADINTTTSGANNAPAATTPTSISQATDGSGFISFQTTVSDTDLNNTLLLVEYSDDGGSTFYKAYLNSVTPSSGTVDLNNSNSFQIGTADKIDTSGGGITLTIEWDTKNAGNQNGSLDGLDQSDIQLRVYPHDSIDFGAAATSSSFRVDNLDPTISQVSAVVSPTNDNTPNYTFTTDEAGTISYGGDCSSVTSSASSGNNTITFNALADGTHSNCTIVVSDAFGNASNTLNVNSFTVDTGAPALSSWSINMGAHTITLTFDESVDASTLDVTAITIQDAATATTSVTLSDSTTASGDGTSIVIDLGSTDLANIQGNAGLATSSSDSYLRMTSSAINDLAGNPVTAIADGSAVQTSGYTTGDTHEQSAFRFFANSNSTDVGSALAAQNTAVTLGANGDAFRLRMLLHIGVSSASINHEDYKLQYAIKSGTCDTSFTGETYADVTSISEIGYYDNAGVADGDNLTGNANDPVHSGHTTVDQDYEEANNFTNSVAAIPVGQDGMWDFALVDNDDGVSVSYCLRMVEADGTLFDTYTVIPEVATAASTDATPPQITSWDLDLDAGTLTINFNENMETTLTPDFTKITIQDAATAVDSYTLTGGSHSWSDANTVVITLSSTDLNAIKLDQSLATLLSDSYLRIASANNMKDVSANELAAIANGSAVQASTYTADTTAPSLSSWSIDMSANTLTMNFSEPVDASTLGVTAITVQDAATAGTSRTLADSTTASADGTSIVVSLGSADLSNIEANDALATALADSYLRITSSAINDMAGNAVTAIADGSAVQAGSYTAGAEYDLSAFRLFANSNSTDVGSTLAAQNTGATLTSNADAFRLRFLIHQNVSDLGASGETFKLQVSDKSGTCDAAFAGESYSDVSGSSAIAYYDNASPADGDNLTGNVNDPVHSGHTTVDQDYEEANNFTNSVAAIPAGQDGMWDFALVDNDGAVSTSHCLRVVKSDGSLLENYSAVAEVTTSSAADLTAPQISTWTLDLDAGTLTLNFNEAMNTGLTPDFTTITVQDAATGVDSYTLTGGSHSWSDADTVVITLSTTDLNAIKLDQSLATLLSDSYVLISSGSNLKDVAGNELAAISNGSAVQAAGYTADTTAPSLSTWNLNLSAGTITMNFDEPIDVSTLDVTAITIQDSSTATATYTLTNSSSASSDGTLIVITLSSTDLNGIGFDTVIATSSSSSYLRMTSAAINDMAGNSVTAINNGSAMRVTSYTSGRRIEDADYRWFANANSTNVGSALAAENTAYTLSASGEIFRLRKVLDVYFTDMANSEENFKLQFAQKSGTCDTAFSGETYADVTGSTAIAFYNNASPADGDALTGNVNDPIHEHAAPVNNNQTYEEVSGYTNSQSVIPAGETGMWDFALYDNGAPVSTSYCFRTVYSNGSTLWAYEYIPEITTAGTGNSAPTASSPSSISQSSSGNGYVTFSTTIADSDLEGTMVKIEYSDDGGSTWYDAYLVSATPSTGTVDMNNANTYQIGTINNVDTNTGSVVLTIVWDSQSASNGNGALTDEQSDVRFRVTAYDGTDAGTPSSTSNFSVDNSNPSGLGGFSVTSSTTSSMSLAWNTVSDVNFDHYEIWYGTNLTDVQNRTGSASEWDNSDVAGLANANTRSTTITGLTAGTSYYFKIWAYDVNGNKITVQYVNDMTSNTSGGGVASSGGGGGGGGGTKSTGGSTSSGDTSTSGSGSGSGTGGTSTSGGTDNTTSNDAGQTTPSCSSGATYTQYMYYDFVDIEVRALQEYLQCLGYLPSDVAISGIYNQYTEDAVKELQSDYGLDPLGVVGPTTRELLNEMSYGEVVQPPKNKQFWDVGGHWGEDVIDFMADVDIIQGNPDGSFDPNGVLNRAEAAALGFRILGLEVKPVSSSPFPDVPVNQWYTSFVLQLNDLKVLSGYGDGNYRPGQNVNRAEFLKIALNTYRRSLGLEGEFTSYSGELKYVEKLTNRYVDLDQNAWYAELVSYATELGFIKGSACGNSWCFNAGNYITRAEAAQMLYNMFAKQLSVELQSEDYSDNTLESLMGSKWFRNIYIYRTIYK